MKVLVSNKWLCLALVASFLIAGCAGTPKVNPALQKVEKAYNKIENDSLVVNNAPVALSEAEEAVQQVKKSSSSGEVNPSVEQQAYLAMQRIKIAQKTAKLRAAQEQVQRASTELEILLENLRQAQKEQKGLRLLEMDANERAKQLINFSARQTERGLVLRFLNLNFALEKASLTSSTEPAINELTGFLEAYPKRNIRIEGYTDSTGPTSLNKKLSQQRADVVRDALVSRGIAEGRITAVGLGEQYPIASNKTKAGRQKNRRVEVVISDTSGVIPDRQQQ